MARPERRAHVGALAHRGAHSDEAGDPGDEGQAHALAATTVQPET